MIGTRRIGVISDTHGLLRPQALAALEGSELIVHAGDLGDPSVLTGLEAIAPLRAVRGNVDSGGWARGLPETSIVELDDVRLYVLHDLDRLDLDPRAAGFAVVISGHTHAPRIDERQGVLYLNPGSAGPRRFHQPISLARLEISGVRVRARLIALEP